MVVQSTAHEVRVKIIIALSDYALNTIRIHVIQQNGVQHKWLAVNANNNWHKSIIGMQFCTNPLHKSFEHASRYRAATILFLRRF